MKYSYRGYLADVKEQIVNMAVNGSVMRDTARGLKISPTTVIEEIKNQVLMQVNQPLIEQLGST